MRRLLDWTGGLIKRFLAFFEERSLPKTTIRDPDPYEDEDNIGAC